jgi:predicted secreted Zn-dependent protease
MQLLEHEQIHFDIAEVAARRIRAGFAGFRNACAEAGGTDPIQQMVAQGDRDLQEEQQRYDRETAHGTNPRAQEQWTLKVRKALN